MTPVTPATPGHGLLARRTRHPSRPAGPVTGALRPRLGKKLLVRIFRRALQARIRFGSPNSLQIGFAPGRFQCGG